MRLLETTYSVVGVLFWLCINYTFKTWNITVKVIITFYLYNMYEITGKETTYE